MVSTDILDTHLYVWVFGVFFGLFPGLNAQNIGLPSPIPDTWQSQW